jgi:hypothetical protein
MDLPLLRARVRGCHAARVLATSVLDEAPDGAVVLLSSDHLVFSALYLQEAEGHRPDLVLVNLGFLSSAWYWRHLARRHPGLTVSLAPGVGATERLRRFLAANGARPVVAESGAALARIGLPACEGTFAVHASPHCAAPDLARRRAMLTRAARDVQGDWIGERVVAYHASNLATEARVRGAPGRAAWTLASASPSLRPDGDLLPAAPDDPRRARPPIPRPPQEALIGPDDLRYELGRTLLEAGEARGLTLLREAAAEGVAAAERDLARAR